MALPRWALALFIGIVCLIVGAHIAADHGVLTILGWIFVIAGFFLLIVDLFGGTFTRQ